MPNYPDDYDWPMSETFRRGLAALDGTIVLPLGEPILPLNPYTVTRGDVQAILLAQVKEQQEQIAELQRINWTLNDQLRANREARQERAQPPPIKKLPGIPVKD